jgi:predicted nucleic acid-binding protein
VSRVLFDAGALIALDRNDPSMWSRLQRARRDALPLLTHGGVIGQVWRGARRARLAQALQAIEVKPLDDTLGRLAGQLLAKSSTSDVIDAALVLLSRSGDRIYTSDPDDLLRLAAAALRDVEVVPV